MRFVRSALLVGWCVLSASLLWDPITASLTSPGNLASPFRVRDAVVDVQGQALAAVPYPMGARVFWTMVLPCVPLALMLLGHETWRRVCPLSHLSQLPRMLGRQRRVKTLNRSSGRVERLLALIPGQSWLGRNHLYLQLGVLAVGVVGRLLFYNSDRLALAAAFAVVGGAALIVGSLYGGKTWCNYFCPVAVIQGIYTGPGGLLDSKAHTAHALLGQSTCRVSGPDGDRSACVGCRPACPDVDVENAYWKTLEADQTRTVYYSFFGLVFGFYTYYYVYSGGWSYYMSGLWTHEADQMASLFAPGFYLGGVAVAVPKLIAAPLYVACCMAASYGLFALAERGYARLRAWRGEVISQARLRHHMLTACAFVTFNLFYAFAGRPNILLMPVWAARLIDMVIVATSVGWLVRSLARDADMYRRERLARSLREQLTRMGFHSEDVIDGRAIDRLSADEVYVLAKTLPNFSAQQKRDAYRAILTEAIETGEIRTPDSLDLLEHLRAQLGLSEAEHHAIVDVLGIHDPTLLDPQIVRGVERRLRHENYRKFIVSLVESARVTGVTAADYLASDEAMHAAEPARALFNVPPEDHARIVADVARDETVFSERMRLTLNALCALEASRFSLRLDERPQAGLLRHALLLKQRVLVREASNLLPSIGDDRRALPFARSLRSLLGSDVEATLPKCADGDDPIWPSTRDLALPSYLDVIEAAVPADDVFRALAEDRDPAIAAVAASALGERSALVQLMADLLNVNVFAALELRTLADIARRSSMLAFKAGDTICHAGETSDSMFVMTHGAAEVWIDTGGFRHVVGRLQDGAVFGELGVLTGRPRGASISVTSPAAAVVAIPGDVIETCIGGDPHAVRGILTLVSGYLLDTLADEAAPRDPAAARQPQAAA